MALGILESIRTARSQLIVDAIDGGAGAGKLQLYNGTRPATGAAITTETLLGTLTFSDPCGVSASGVLTFSAVTDGTALATNTISWARIVDSTDAFVLDLSCTATGGGGDIEFSSLAVVEFGAITVTGGAFTEGNA